MKVELNSEIRKILETEQSPVWQCANLLKYLGEKPRVNADTMHFIFYAQKVPKLPGFRDTEVVIGMRPTEFCPFVAWLCFDGKDYAYGDYCQTLEGVIECANAKLEREMRS